MPEVLVGLGSNADPVAALRGAVAALAERLATPRCSSVYRSPAHGAPGADYLNLVVAFETTSGISELGTMLRALEGAAGRQRTNPAVVALDLDLLLYGARVDAAQRLPRPGAFRLPFVLGPLAELCPELVHPVTGERAAAVWRRTPHASLVCLGPLTELAPA
jgi:2-amino-4-hydroxy-6-hydroxymethyldihydropteridine diphosphokinase